MYIIRRIVFIIALLFAPISTYSQYTPIDQDVFDKEILKSIREGGFKSSFGREFKLESIYVYYDLDILGITNRIIDITTTKDGISQSEIWEILSIKKIDILKDCYLISLYCSKYPENSYEAIYNKLDDKIYILNLAELDDLNNLLLNEDLSLKTDYEILRYCRLLTLFKNPYPHVKFISSINELIMEAIYDNMAVYDLADSLKFQNIKVGLPSIVRDEELIRVNFNVASGEDILNVKISLKGKKIIEFSEDIVGYFPYWW